MPTRYLRKSLGLVTTNFRRTEERKRMESPAFIVTPFFFPETGRRTKQKWQVKMLYYLQGPVQSENSCTLYSKGGNRARNGSKIENFFPLFHSLSFST